MRDSPQARPRSGSRCYWYYTNTRLAVGDTDSLLAYRSRAPRPDLAVPTTEHFDPLFCAAGAAFDDERVTRIYEGFRYGNLSMRSFLFSAG